MLTSLEIARLLKKQRREKEKNQGFDTALIGLGIKLKGSKKLAQTK